MRSIWGRSGTTVPVFVFFIAWLAEETEPVFAVATAIEVSQLPPELNWKEAESLSGSAMERPIPQGCDPSDQTGFAPGICSISTP